MISGFLRISLVAAMLCVMAGCVLTPPMGSHVYNHDAQGTGAALRGLGEIAYQLRGKTHGVTRTQYDQNMQGLQNIGNLMDYANQR